MTGADKTISFNAALENVSQELDALTQKAVALDEAIGAAIAAPDASSAFPVTLMQDVDLVRQSADCLRIVMRNLVEITETGPQPPDVLQAAAVIDGVYLAALRDRVLAAQSLQVEGQEDLGDWIDM